jgi:hypothetical protein
LVNPVTVSVVAAEAPSSKPVQSVPFVDRWMT